MSECPPAVSVIIAVYNGAATLGDCLRSVCAQTLQNLEIICVDDASTDATAQVIETWADGDSRVRGVRQIVNRGQGSARNRGLEMARGKYVIMLDADDIFRRDFLECLYAQAERLSADIVMCNSAAFDSSGLRPSGSAIRMGQLPGKEVFSGEDMPDFMFSAFKGWAWDKLYRRAFVMEHSLAFPDLRNSEDAVFVYKSLLLASRISVVDQVLVRHRVDDGRSVSRTRDLHPDDFYRAVLMLKDWLGESVQRVERYQFGFLNWAFEYMVWNIGTLQDRNVRHDMIRRALSGEFEAIEYRGRSRAFFSLYDNSYWNYIKLARQVGVRLPGCPSAHLLAVFLRQIEEIGLSGALSAVLDAVQSRNALAAAIVRRAQRRVE